MFCQGKNAMDNQCNNNQLTRLALSRVSEWQHEFEWKLENFLIKR